MRNIVLIVTFLFVFPALISAQLVTKRDYNVAFAVQAGGNAAILLPGKPEKVSLQPEFGLKMTFPFTRKWFLGAEVNYNRLNTKIKFSDIYLSSSSEEIYTATTPVDVKSIQVPIYIKYMLNSNRAGVLFGVYGSLAFNTDFIFTENNGWGAGVIIGYEQNLAKGLDLTFKVSGGIQDLSIDQYYPVQTSLTLSYRLLRLGGCKCD